MSDSPAGLPIGVIGLGSLGFHHARILRDQVGADLVGGFDTDAARRAFVASELSIPVFDSLDALLARIEAAVVAVPTVAHAEVALAAIDRGVHLLIEKPIAPSLEDADAILSRADAKGVLIAIGHVERYNAALRACEPYLDRPRFIESHRLAPFGPRGTDVAVVLDLMIHDIDLVLTLVGEPVRSVDAVGVSVLTPSVDIANARLRFQGGAVANITASRISQDRMRKIRIFQNSGYISLDLAAGTGEFLRLRPDAVLRLFPGAGAAALHDIVERVSLTGDGRQPLQCELEAFVAAVQGADHRIVSGVDGREALAVALQIVSSIDANVLDPRPS
jgi:predicted dehydrogenase